MKTQTGKPATIIWRSRLRLPSPQSKWIWPRNCWSNVFQRIQFRSHSFRCQPSNIAFVEHQWKYFSPVCCTKSLPKKKQQRIKKILPSLGRWCCERRRTRSNTEKKWTTKPSEILVYFICYYLFSSLWISKVLAFISLFSLFYTRFIFTQNESTERATTATNKKKRVVNLCRCFFN